jgi:O-antigen/teichoic acid export membrane protein
LSTSEIDKIKVPLTFKASGEAARPKGLPSRLFGLDQDNLVERLLFWVRRGGIAILDQGLISGSNFLVSVLLARWLTAEQYGSYAVAFGIFILLSLVYQSLVLEPMSVFGGSIHRNNLRGYFASLLWIHVTLSLSIFLLFGTSAALARLFGQAAGLPGALAGVTIASPCVLFFWLARRSFYLELSPSQAAVGAFVYAGFVLTSLWIFYRHQMLSPFTAFVLIAIGALGTGSFLMVRLRLAVRQEGTKLSTWTTWRQHWSYGGWALAGCIASWVPAYIFYPVLSTFGTMAQSGDLKALMNLTLPLEQTKAALSMLLLPYAAGVQDAERGSGGKLLSLRLTLVGLGLAVAYWIVIIPMNRPLFHFLYSGRYMDIAYQLPLVAVGSIFWSAAFGPAIALRATKSPATVFAAYLFAAVASLLIGIPATWKFGLTGAIWGNNVADIASFLGVSFLLFRKLNTTQDVALASNSSASVTLET